MGRKRERDLVGDAIGSVGGTPSETSSSATGSRRRTRSDRKWVNDLERDARSKPKPKPESEPVPQRRSTDTRGTSNPFPDWMTTSSASNAGAKFILGALLWAWVGLPFLDGGIDGVKTMLKAKFVNKAPDGSYLP